MALRIFAISFIYLASLVAWLVLGTTIFHRTYQSDSALRGKVASTWGTPQCQRPAVAWGDKAQLPLEKSRINVELELQHRQKGLLWYSTYGVQFRGEYTFRNNTDHDRTVTFALPLPAQKAIYDGLTFMVDGSSEEVRSDMRVEGQRILLTSDIPAGQSRVIRAAYRSRGIDRWQYHFGDSGVKDFGLTMTTNFEDIDFPEDTLSPSDKKRAGNGWELVWSYATLVSGVNIALAMPAKLQPGQLAGEISMFAPVSLFFFFFLIFMVTTIRKIELHPMNYFFLAAAFFAFHLLLAYLVDHISIHAAFAICSAVSIFLVISYLRIVVGPQFAFREAAGAQFIYLVAFSYAFFFKGLTGLVVTVGSILTLFAVMQITARIQWSTRFAVPPSAPTLD